MGNQAYFQVNGTPSYNDFPFKNYGTTDIGAGLCVILDTTNVLGATTAADGIGVKLPAADGAITIGITMEKIVAGQTGRVRCGGIAQSTASGAITAGGAVMSTNGTNQVGFVKASTAAAAQVGIALNTCADGDPCLVLVSPAKNA